MRTGAALALAVVLVGACTRPGAVERLERMPEARLRYPGATVVGASAVPAAEAPTGGKVSAHVFADETTRDAPASILAWYGTELTARGWRETTDAPGPGIGVVAQGTWSKGDRRYVVVVRREARGDTRFTTTLS
jgi:hypothetical protein